MHTDQRPAGPDFLANFPEQSLAQGLLDNAAEFRVRASEWRRDQALLEQQASTIAALQSDLRRIRTQIVQAAA